MTQKSIKVVVGSKTEQPCVYVLDLTPEFYERIQATRKKLKERKQTNPELKSLGLKNHGGVVYPYFLRSNIIRGIEKQERDITGLVSLAIHDKHFTRKVTEEIANYNTNTCFYYVEQEYETDLLGYFMKSSTDPLRIMFFDDFIGFLSLEEPGNIQHVSYPISYDELEDAYNHMLYYYEELENPDEYEDEDLDDYLNY